MRINSNGDENNEPEYKKISCWKSKFIPWFLSLLASLCLALNLFLDFTSGEGYQSLIKIVTSIYILSFTVVLVITAVLPIPLLIIEVFAFMNTRFGPGMYIIFVGKNFILKILKSCF